MVFSALARAWRHFSYRYRVHPTYRRTAIRNTERARALAVSARNPTEKRNPCSPTTSAITLLCIGLIPLHFHELGCTNRGALCTNQGCLHQVYISTDGAYRLAFSANVPNVTLALLDHTPEIEIHGEIFGWRSRVLHWNGRDFVEK